MTASLLTGEPTGTPRADTEPAAPALLQLVRVELRKSYDTRAGRWLLLVIGLGALAIVALPWFAHDAARTFGSYLSLTQIPVGVLLPVLGVLLVTSEWSQRTAMTTFALVPRRSRVLTAKLLAASALAVLGVVASIVAAAVGTLLTPALTDSALDWQTSGAQLGQVVLLQVLYVLAGVALGVLLLNSPLAIVLYFVLPTAFTILVNTVSTLEWVRDWLDLSTTTLPMYDGRLDAQGWLQLATSAALWIGLPMVVGWRRICRAEIA
jgi:ABC-type transport system involved in multi-copper enzyme maturation permease subunit